MTTQHAVLFCSAILSLSIACGCGGDLDDPTDPLSSSSPTPSFVSLADAPTCAPSSNGAVLFIDHELVYCDGARYCSLSAVTTGGDSSRWTMTSEPAH